jgi:hypothetical protein
MIPVKKIAIASLLAAIAAGAVGWLVVFPTPRFPKPGGPYGIGTRIYSWTGPTRPEPFTAEPGDHRELVVCADLVTGHSLGRACRAHRSLSRFCRNQRLHPGLLRSLFEKQAIAAVGRNPRAAGGRAARGKAGCAKRLKNAYEAGAVSRISKSWVIVAVLAIIADAEQYFSADRAMARSTFSRESLRPLTTKCMWMRVNTLGSC